MNSSTERPSGIKDRTIKGIAWTSVGVFTDELMALIMFLLLARLLPPEAFGIIAMATTFIAFVNIFADQGLSKSIIQRHELDDLDLDTAFWTTVALGLAFTTLGVVLSGAIAAFYNQPELQPVVAALSFNFVINAFSGTQQGLLQRNLQFRGLTLRMQLARIVSGVVAVIAALIGLGVWSLVIQSLLSGFVGAVTLWTVSSWRPKFRFSKARLTHLYSFGSQMVGLSFLGFLKTRTDDLLIGYFLGPTLLGYYTVAYRLMRTILDASMTIFGRVSFSVFSRLQHETEELAKAVPRFVHSTALLTFPVFMGSIFIAPLIIEALFGEKWLPSVPIMRVLNLAGFTTTIGLYSRMIMTAMNRPGLALRLDAFFTGIMVVAFFVTAQMGIVAVAASYTVVLIPSFFVSLHFARQVVRFDLRAYFGGLAAPMGASLLMGILALLLQNWLQPIMPPIAALAVVGVTSALFYLVLVTVMQPSLIQHFYRPFVNTMLHRRPQRNPST